METGEARQPITNSDSHFLAWTPDGEAAYLIADSINSPRIVREPLTGGSIVLSIPELTYDIAPAPGGDEFTYTFSRGMGLGSEMWLARQGGNAGQRIAADPNSYLALARWSPDGRHIAFIKVPDSATPFTVGELWLMGTDGTQAHRLAEADDGPRLCAGVVAGRLANRVRWA